jgi:hypothetical protein
MLAVLAAVGAMLGGGVYTPVPPVDDSEAAWSRWIEANLVTDDWMEISRNTDGVRFTTASGFSRMDNDHIRVWVRQEYFRPDISGGRYIRSAMELDEIDCGDTRMRILAVDTFPYNNLAGEKQSDDAQEPTWMYPRPSTIGAIEVKFVCDVKAMADAQPATPTEPNGVWTSGDGSK